MEKALALDVTPLSAALAWAHGDGVKLQQILIKLLGNAVRLTSVGAVAPRARCEGAREGPGAGAHDPAGEQRRWDRFDVIDTGPGIAKAERERIFEPLDQAPMPCAPASAAGGSGLGGDHQTPGRADGRPPAGRV